LQGWRRVYRWSFITGTDRQQHCACKNYLFVQVACPHARPCPRAPLGTPKCNAWRRRDEIIGQAQPAHAGKPAGGTIALTLQAAQILRRWYDDDSRTISLRVSLSTCRPRAVGLARLATRLARGAQEYPLSPGKDQYAAKHGYLSGAVE
jgi:hypothetical protein